MIEILTLVFNNINNYVFGNIVYTGLAFTLAIVVYMIANNVDIGTTLAVLSIGTIIASFVIFPTWVAISILIIIGIIISWAIIKIVGAI